MSPFFQFNKKNVMEKSNNEIVKALNKVRMELQCLTGIEKKVMSTMADISESMGNTEKSMNQLFTSIKRGYDSIEDCLQDLIDHSDHLLYETAKGQLDINKADIEAIKGLLENELESVKGGNESLGNIRNFIDNLDTNNITPLDLDSGYKAPYVAGIECVYGKIDEMKVEVREQLVENSKRTEDPNNIYSQYIPKVDNETMEENDALTKLDLELSDVQAIRVHIDEVESLLIQIREILKDIYARLGITNNLLGTIITRIETTNTKLDTLDGSILAMTSVLEDTNTKLDTLISATNSGNSKLDTLISGNTTLGNKLDQIINNTTP